MSARAAWRLVSLGFTQVLRYQPGKADWAAHGLPMEGKRANVPRAGDIVRKDAPTCALTERVGTVRDRARASGWGMCLVVNDEGVVLGRLRQVALDADPAATVETVMEGPTTIRPNTVLADITERMHDRKVESIIVTDSDGRLLGILFREDADRRLKQSQAATQPGAQ